MIERHWHWEFSAFDEGQLNVEKNNILWPVRIEVIGYLSEADARIAAQDILQRDHFKLSRVWECQTCGFQQSGSDALQKIAVSSAS